MLYVSTFIENRKSDSTAIPSQNKPKPQQGQTRQQEDDRLQIPMPLPQHDPTLLSRSTARVSAGVVGQIPKENTTQPQTFLNTNLHWVHSEVSYLRILKRGKKWKVLFTILIHLEVISL